MQKILQILLCIAAFIAGTVTCPPARSVKERTRKMEQAHLIAEHRALTETAARLGAKRRAATPGLDLTKEREAYNARLNEYAKKHAAFKKKHSAHVEKLHKKMATNNNLQNRPARTTKP